MTQSTVYVVISNDDYTDKYQHCCRASSVDEVIEELRKLSYTWTAINSFAIIPAIDDYQTLNYSNHHEYMQEVLGDRYGITNYLVLYFGDEVSKVYEKKLVEQLRRNDLDKNLNDLIILQRNIYDKIAEDMPDDVKGHLHSSVLIVYDAIAQLQTAKNKLSIQ